MGFNSGFKGLKCVPFFHARDPSDWFILQKYSVHISTIKTVVTKYDTFPAIHPQVQHSWSS